MSIINDALKKTQMSFKKKDKPPEQKPESKKDAGATNVYEKFYQKNQEQAELKGVATAGQKTKQQASVKRKAEKANPLETLIKIGVFIVILGAAGYVGYGHLMKIEAVEDFVSTIKKKAKKSSSYAQRPAKQRTYAPGELVLNGTSLIDGIRVALINDEIYEIGDVVSGKTVTSISLNEVELQDEETITTLKVH